MMYWDNGHGGGGWGILMFFMMVALLAVLAVLALLVVRGGHARHTHGHDSSSARRILGERLARGEIDAEEYQSRLAALQAAG